MKTWQKVLVIIVAIIMVGSIVSYLVSEVFFKHEEEHGSLSVIGLIKKDVSRGIISLTIIGSIDQIKTIKWKINEEIGTVKDFNFTKTLTEGMCNLDIKIDPAIIIKAEIRNSKIELIITYTYENKEKTAIIKIP